MSGFKRCKRHGVHLQPGGCPECIADEQVQSRARCNKCLQWYPTTEIAYLLMSGCVCKKCES